jgi:hypothetical protein
MDSTPTKRDYPANLGVADLTLAWRSTVAEFLSALDDRYGADPRSAATSARYICSEALSGRWGPVGVLDD